MHRGIVAGRVWNGSLLKRAVKAWFEFDNPSHDEVGDPNEDWPGTIFVSMPGGTYSWDHQEYGTFRSFEQSGFDTAWLNENLPISPWGHPRR
jgi:hypothetical protein